MRPSPAPRRWWRARRLVLFLLLLPHHPSSSASSLLSPPAAALVVRFRRCRYEPRILRGSAAAAFSLPPLVPFWASTPALPPDLLRSSIHRLERGEEARERPLYEGGEGVGEEYDSILRRYGLPTTSPAHHRSRLKPWFFPPWTRRGRNIHPLPRSITSVERLARAALIIPIYYAAQRLLRATQLRWHAMGGGAFVEAAAVRFVCLIWVALDLVMLGAQLAAPPPWTPTDHIDVCGLLKGHFYLVPVGKDGGDDNEGNALLANETNATAVDAGGSTSTAETTKKVAVTMRQVPGDGSCLFHAVAACLDHDERALSHQNRGGSADDIEERSVGSAILTPWSILRLRSEALRAIAVDRLTAASPDDGLLVLAGADAVPTGDFLDAVASAHGMTRKRYLQKMRRATTWGGGPELVALSNALRRRICLYEVANNAMVGEEVKKRGDFDCGDGDVLLRRFACFGADSCESDVKLLLTDESFPNEDIHASATGRRQNHFLAILL